MEDAAELTRAAWAVASQKYQREHEEHLEAARTAELLPSEVEAIGALLPGADVVHPLSGHGLDFSEAAVDSAQRRADALGAPCRYTRATLPGSGLPDGCADLVYTGKGALIWLADLDAFLAEVHRLLRPGGRFFVHEAHSLVPLWAWEPDEIRVRSDRGYFERQHVNDTFPAHGAVEQQRTLAELVMACVGAGFVLERFTEHPEPFWRPDGTDAAAWDGRVPNAFSLLARRTP